MSEPSPFDFRSPHGVKRVTCTSAWWNGITVRHVVQHLDEGRAWHDLGATETTVVVLLEQVGGYCEPRLSLNRPTPLDRSVDGHTVCVPAQSTVWGYSDGIRSTRDLRLSFDHRVLESTLGEDLQPSKATTPLLLFYDDRVARCASLLAEECDNPQSNDGLYGQSLTTALTSLLFGPARRSPKRRASRLSPWQLRRVLEHFREHLSHDVSLAESAILTGLSQSQFARSFKASTGVSPYQWFLEARVRRAQELLLQGDVPIANIAAQLGFADQSHFTKTFRRTTGTTPKNWQRARRA